MQNINLDKNINVQKLRNFLLIDFAKISHSNLSGIENLINNV